MRYSVQYAACAYGHIGSCVSIGLSSHGPGSFIYPTQDHPDARVVDGCPTETLQDFPVPQNLTPEVAAGMVSLSGYPSPGNNDGAAV
jgi:hypothetical protein